MYCGYRTEEGHPILFRRRDGGPAEPIDTDRVARLLAPHLVGGVEWGYGGAGPLLLSLMLLLDATGDPDLSLSWYHGFMWVRVRGWCSTGWEITDYEIRDWCAQAESEALPDTRYSITDRAPPEGGG